MVENMKSIIIFILSAKVPDFTVAPITTNYDC